MIVLTPRQKRAQALNASIEVEWNAHLAAHANSQPYWYSTTNIKCFYWIGEKIKEYRDDNPKIGVPPYATQAVKSQLMIKRYREHLAAFRLQRWFHHISTTIHYAFCKRRVNGHYDLYKGNNR